MTQQFTTQALHLLQTKQFGALKELGEKLNQESPNNPFGLKCIAMALNGEGENEKSIELMKQISIQFPNDGENWLNLGKSLHQKNMLLESHHALFQAYKLLPASVDSCNELAKVLIKLYRYDEAHATLLQSFSIDSANLSTVLMLSDVLVFLGNPLDAKTYLESVLSNHPKNPILHNHLATTLQMLKEFSQAIEHYKNALLLLLEYPLKHSKQNSHTSFNQSLFEEELLKILALFYSNTINAFACSGTLLGLTREGHLLPFDKDIDIGVPFEKMDFAVELIQKNGYKEHQYSYMMSNPRVFRHEKSGLIIDLCGHQKLEDTDLSIAGLWMDGVSLESNRVTVYQNKELELETKTTEHGKIFEIKNKDAYLTRLYGSWKIKDTHFDTIVMAPNIQSFSPLVECFALDRIFFSLLSSNLTKAKILSSHALSQKNSDLFYILLDKKIQTLG